MSQHNPKLYVFACSSHTSSNYIKNVSIEKSPSLRAHTYSCERSNSKSALERRKQFSVFVSETLNTTQSQRLVQLIKPGALVGEQSVSAKSSFG